MIKIAGNWELSWNTPIKEAELWNFVLRDFEIKYWYMWPISGIRHNENNTVSLIEKHDLKSILEDNQNLTHVYVEPDNDHYRHYGTDLRDFEHPKDVLYIFGSAHFNPVIGHKRAHDLGIIIPTIQNKGVLWPHQCLLTILYDRMVKGWQ